MGLLVAGTKYRGEFEERLKKLMEEIKQNDDIILVRNAESIFANLLCSPYYFPFVCVCEYLLLTSQLARASLESVIVVPVLCH